jgi:hypothetical protein
MNTNFLKGYFVGAKDILIRDEFAMVEGIHSMHREGNNIS